MAKLSKRGHKAPPRARRKTLAPRKTAASAKSGDASLKQQLAEARAQQAATSDILAAMSGSMTDARPVFDAIVKSCHSLFKESGVGLRLLRDGVLHVEANVGYDAGPLPVDRGSAVGACVLDARTIHFPDLEAAAVEFPRVRQLGLKFGYHSGVYAPLLHSGNAIGTIAVLRPKRGAFSEKEVALLKTFADQAVIAIENVRLFNETKEALERQRATADVLASISGSMANTQPVFDRIVQNVRRLFGTRFAVLQLLHGDTVEMPAIDGDPEYPGFEKLRERYPRPLDETTVGGQAMLSKQAFQLAPVIDNPAAPPGTVQFARDFGFNSVIFSPMIHEGRVIGAIGAAHPGPKPFDERQIALIKTFADQAVIAIQNARLFNETREALERQTATAEILSVISSSPTNVQPVFDAIAASALRLFGGLYVAVVLVRDEKIEIAATGGAPEIVAKATSAFPIPLDRESITGRVIVDRAVQNIPDMEDPALPEFARALSRGVGVRALLGAPMLREGAPIGAIMLMREHAGEFSAKQVALLKTFADQAVIAIENVRLFNETKESLERQTATAEILKVIASSPSDVQPVFDAIAKSALRLIGGLSSVVTRVVDDMQHLAAFTTMGDTGDESIKGLFPRRIGELNSGRAIATRAPSYRIDTETDPDISPAARENARARGYRSALAVPMLRDGVAIGTISVSRREPGRFSEHQIAVLQTFADQAVIAIENVRLFKELEARTEALTRSVEQLTALGEVGQAISSTLDLATVLQTIVSRAVQLTGMDGGTIYEYDERTEEFNLRAAENLSDEVVEMLRETPMRKGEGAIGHAVETGEPTEIADMRDESYQSPRRDFLIQAGYRALLVVPLLREEHIIGALAVNRKAPGPFSHEVVELLKTFATQSAMAIQNARLFREIAEKGRQLEEASQHKSQFLASMSHELRTPLNAILGFNEMILGQVYGEVPADMQEPLNDIQTSGKHLLRLINNVLDLAKIEAGRMELSLADYSVHDTVASVHSTLRPLAAEKGLEFLASVPDDVPLAYGDGGRIAQCLMNLAGNSLKFTKAGKVEIAVECRGELLVYKVADTGIGIPPDKIGSLFTEFKQTDATIASEYGGTGLGLSISRKFVEMHGGRIWVESELGKGSAFIIEVPLRVKTA